MTTSFSGSAGVTNRITYSEALAVGTLTAPPISQTKKVAYTNGHNTGQCDIGHQFVDTINANTTNNYNLANNTLTSLLNLPIAMVRVKSITVELLKNTEDGAGNSNAASVTYSGLNGAAGFTDGTTPKRRVFNGGWDGCADPSNGVTAALNIAIYNEDLTTKKATVRVTVNGAQGG